VQTEPEMCRGQRLGKVVPMRDTWAEELEAALSGK
jgi:hypothetical protein